MTDPAPQGSDLLVTRLDDGLTVVTERVPGALSLAAGVWVGIGARDEPAPISGVSHFLEHLLFKGTEEHAAQEIARTIDRHGGDINAHTSKEYTAYYCRLPARHASIGLGLLGEVLTSPALRESDVETERQVILEELAMDEDNPDDIAHRTFGEQLYLDHPLGRDSAGDPESVEAITVDDIRRFFADHYTAGSMVASLAGPLGHDEMLGLVDAALSGLPCGGERPVRLAPAHIGESCVIDDDTEQVHIVLGGRAVPRGDDDREALDIVNHVLGGGLSSRLFEEIREKRGLVYAVYSGLSAYSDVGGYTIYAGAHPRHADEVIALIRGELDRLLGDGIDDEELDIAKGSLMGSFELGLEDTGARMSRNGVLQCTLGRLRSPAEQVARWDAVDQPAIRSAIERVFTADPILIRLGPS